MAAVADTPRAAAAPPTAAAAARGGPQKEAPPQRAAPDFLVVVVDVNPHAWLQDPTSSGAPDARLAIERLQHTIASLLVFLNAHTSMHYGNGLAVYGAVTDTAELLFSTSRHSLVAQHRDGTQGDTDLSVCLPFKQVDDAVFHGVKRLLERACADPNLPHGHVGMVRALSMALCHIHRMTSALRAAPSEAPGRTESNGGGAPPGSAGAERGTQLNEPFQYRILILSATPDASTQYVPMMNCIFSAQKQGIPIDVCKLFGEDTVFLRQACHLSGGHYTRLGATDGLLQALMTTYLPSRTIRPSLMFPAEEDVDFRAACFCHRRTVDVAYICSVCLSIYCGPRDSCLICHSHFPLGTLRQLDDERQVVERLRSGAL